LLSTGPALSNGEEVPEWQMMWGAKVKTPVDMPDDIDSLSTVSSAYTQ